MKSRSKFVGQIPIEISGDIPGFPVKIGEANPCEVHISEEKKHINVNKMLPVFSTRFRV